MAVDGISKWTPSQKAGGISWVSGADAGRDGRTRFARPNFQARTGTCSANHEQDWQPYPVDPSLLKLMTIHTPSNTTPYLVVLFSITVLFRSTVL